MQIHDAPTLRLVTLRRLLGGRSNGIVLDRNVSVGTIVRALLAVPRGIVVLVDATRSVVGTVSRDDLRFSTDSARADSVMSVRYLALEPEDDAEDALALLRKAGAERALVVSAAGDLLGVLTTSQIARR